MDTEILIYKNYCHCLPFPLSDCLLVLTSLFIKRQIQGTHRLYFLFGRIKSGKIMDSEIRIGMVCG